MYIYPSITYVLISLFYSKAFVQGLCWFGIANFFLVLGVLVLRRFKQKQDEKPLEGGWKWLFWIPLTTLLILVGRTLNCDNLLLCKLWVLSWIFLVWVCESVLVVRLTKRKFWRGVAVLIVGLEILLMLGPYVSQQMIKKNRLLIVEDLTRVKENIYKDRLLSAGEIKRMMDDIEELNRVLSQEDMFYADTSDVVMGIDKRNGLVLIRHTYWGDNNSYFVLIYKDLDEKSCEEVGGYKLTAPGMDTYWYCEPN